MKKVLKDQLIDIAAVKYKDDENIAIMDDGQTAKILQSPKGYWVEAYIWVASKEVAKPA